MTPRFRRTAGLITLGLFSVSLGIFADDRDDDRGDDPNARAAWFYGPRTDATGHIPPGARIKAIADIERANRTARAKGFRPLADVSGTWSFLGPKPVNGGAGRTVAGRVTSLVIDPRDNNTVYIGALDGGVWKTTDGGAHWTPLGDDQPSLAIGSLALDPNNSSVVYAGTGAQEGGYDNYYGVGILKSTNGGATWTNYQGQFLHNYISGIAVNPSDSNVVLCSVRNVYTSGSTGDGVWRSSDGGANWTRVLNGIGSSVAFDPINRNVAYAALGAIHGSSSNGVYRSADGGQTWSALRGAGANAFPLQGSGRIVVQVAPSTPSIIYAAIEATDGSLLDVYKTTDSGGTWNPTKAPDVCAPSSADHPGQCEHDMAIAIHPKNPNLIYLIGDLSMARSVDGGATWTQVFEVNNFFTGPNGIGLHCDLNAVSFSSDGTKLYMGTDGGAYSTTDINASQLSQINWTELNDTLAIAAFYPGVATHPSDVNRVLAGSQDNFTELYTGSLGWQNVVCGDGGYNAFDGALPTIAFASCTHSNPPVIHRSIDGGSTWVNSAYGVDQSDYANFIPPLVIDPTNGQNVYYGTVRIWQSRDSGGKFTPISPALTTVTGQAITAIAVAPTDGNTVYTATSRVSPYILASTAGNARIHVTTNALGSSPRWDDRSAGLPPRVATSIAIDPIDSATAFVAFSGFAAGSDTQGHLFKTTNSGVNWTDVSGNLPNLPLNDVVIDPDLPNTLYVATDLGVMMTSDGGSTWISVGSGLPKVVVHSVTLHRATRTLRAGTNGRGLWDILVPLSSATRRPSLTALSPASVDVGAAGFTLQVTGSNFVTGTVLRWNGSSRPTSIIDSTHLSAAITSADRAQVGRVTIDAFNPSPGIGASNALPLTIGPAPGLSTQAIVNAAYPAAGLAPYGIATIYGTNLSGAIVVADQAPPLPLTLGGTSLAVNSTTLPLFFVSPGQINFQLPYATDLTAPVSVTIVVTQGTLTSSVRATIRPFAPGLFTTNAQGTGQASALIAGTASIVAPTGTFSGSRPARKGEYVSLYGTGLGDISHRPVIGTPAPSDPLATTLTSPTVTVGNVNAPVVFSGVAPGYVGLYQVNIQIPNNAPSGSAIPVVLTIGGVASNTVTIAVQ